MVSWRNILIGKFTWRRLLLSLAEIYLCVLVWALLFSDSIAFQPPSPSYTSGNGVYCIPSTDGTPLAILALTNATPAASILYIHGNAEDIGGVRFLLEAYQDAGFDVFTFDYRGYGISGGKSSTRHAYEDVDRVYNHLVKERGIDPKRLIVHGRSLGAAVALHLANQRPVAGVIIESAFLTAFRAQTQIAISPFDKMRNDRAIQAIKSPVLVIHGTRDVTIKSWQGKKLYELAPEPKFYYWVEQAGHDDVPAVNEEEYFKRITAFRDFVLAKE
jgi:alpha-beta hydrolase superfamily lysophospholipase